MGKNRSRKWASKSGAKGGSATTDASGGYEAPTVGYEDVLYAHGNTKAAATFNTTNVKLARYVSVQSWSGATIAGRAMELMIEPTIEEPVVPTSTEEVETTVKNQDGTETTTTTTQTKDSAMLQMEMAMHMIVYKVWMEESRSWKTNRARLYTLILVHCPPDLEEVLKTMSAWKQVSEEQDAIGLLKMVRNVAHDQTEAKQTVMRFV